MQTKMLSDYIFFKANGHGQRGIHAVSCIKDNGSTNEWKGNEKDQDKKMIRSILGSM